MSEAQKLNRLSLLATLALVQPGLAKKDLIEGASAFFFRGGRVMTYNDTIAISAPTDVEGTFTVDGNALYKTLKKFPDEEVALLADAKALVVKGSNKRKARFTVAASNSALYDVIGSPTEWLTVPSDFAKSLALVAGAAEAGSKSGKPALGFVRVGGDWCEASDSFRASRSKLTSTWLTTPILIPAQAANKLEDYRVTTFGRTKGWLHFRCSEGVLFSCRTAHSTIQFPDTTTFFMIGTDAKTFALPTEIIEVLDRTAIFSSDNVSLTVADGELIIEGRGVAGDFEERLSVDTGIRAHCSVNTKFLRYAVSMGGDKMVVTDRTARFAANGFEHVVALLVDAKVKTPQPEED